MATPLKPVKPVKPPALKAKTVKLVATATRFTQSGKPDPNGYYDKDGYMVEVPGKKNSFKPPAAIDSSRVKGADGLTPAQRAGYKQ